MVIIAASQSLIVQSDHTVLLDVHAVGADMARAAIAPFADLVKSPEHIHTYRLVPLSIWNARATGMSSDAMIEALTAHARFPVPESVVSEIETLGRRYGMAVLARPQGNTAEGSNIASRSRLWLTVSEPALAEQLASDERVSSLLGERISPFVFELDSALRGELKQALVAIGYPAEDRAGYVEGEPLPLTMRQISLGGEAFSLRAYQQAATEAFHQSGQLDGGSGVIVLPCGAGKTLVGMAAMVAVGSSTLVLTSSLTSVRQWRQELLDKTNLADLDIAEYSGQSKAIGPVTLSTYQVMSYRRSRTSEFIHLELFRARNWGLIIYDEVHLLPAPVFRATAELQARRRLGLTATLIREDGRETDVFALIGPKRYDVPWRELETQGFIATAECLELRVAQDADRSMEYAMADRRHQFRIAAENPAKDNVVQDLLLREAGRKILIIGEYIAQLERLAKLTGLPLVTGKTRQDERDKRFQQFRDGELSGLILSRVGNFALDLPDAEVLIQVSGKFGSRQEEAQRLGRVLRPKRGGGEARFYTLVTLRTREEQFARHRQLFLTEQGYRYGIDVIAAHSAGI